MDKWSGDYSAVVQDLRDESDYAIVSKVVPASRIDNGEIQLTMSGILMRGDNCRAMCNQC